MADDIEDRDSEAWERRMVETMDTVGSRGWLDEARQQRARRIADGQRAAARIDHLAATLTLAHDTAAKQAETLRRCDAYERTMAEQVSDLTADRARVRELIYCLADCGGVRTAKCFDCDWCDNEVCAADLKPLGEWGSDD